MPSPSDRTGSPSPPALEPVLALARAWAGEERLALILGGSHATGEAVWVEHEGRRVSLSDLDLYAVVPGEAAKAAAHARAREARPGLGTRLLAFGLAAPLEVGFHTPEDLAHLPARPASLALRRHGRVVDGDASLLARVPAWTAADVSDEEILLLLENRAFELLWAECLRGASGLAALQRRHAVLKTALDLATVLAFAADADPDGAAAGVAWARERWDEKAAPEPPWDEALAWRAGSAPAGGDEDEAWRRTVRGWAVVWRRLVGDPGDPERPFASVARVASRGHVRRRLREAVLPGRPAFGAFGPVGRLAKAAGGTPQHRLNAAATTWVLAEAERLAGRWTGARGEALARQYRETMQALGVRIEGTDVARALFTTWDRTVLDGQRSEGWAS